MAMVELAFTPLPAHVRTARLVAVAVARRSGVPESLLDEVRLAVGEACSRAVEAHRQNCPAEPVKVELTDSGGRFEVVVTDSGHGAAPADDLAGPEMIPEGTAALSQAGAVPGASAAEAHNGLPAALGNGHGGLEDGFGLAVIAELADDVRISRTPAGISVCMSWPSSAR
ncbi:MAG TPA: ATP-binding protein [Streptosporangiaceae bacterium]